MTDDQCCDEYGCKRKQPIHIMRGSLTGCWYVVTKWKSSDGEHFTAQQKHELPEQYQVVFDAAFPNYGLSASAEDD